METYVPRETWRQRRVRQFQSFDVWRRAVTANLILVPLLILGYWVLWFFVDRSVVASDSAAQYVSFEQAFPLSDAFLMATAALAVLQLWRGRPSALVWLLVLGGGGVYLFGLDVLYDLEHGVYANGGGAGLIELGINFYTLMSGVGVIYFGWSFQRELLAD